MPGYRRVSPSHVVDTDTGEEFFMPDPELGAVPPAPADEIEMPAEFVGPESPVPLNMTPGSETWGAYDNPFGGPPPGPGMNGPLPTPRAPEEIQAAVEAATPPPQLPPNPYAGPPPAPAAPPKVTPGMEPQDPYASRAPKVPKNRQEMANMYGDLIASNEQAARSQYAADLALADAEKKSADELAAATTGFAERQAASMAEADAKSMERWEGWRKEYDEAAKAQVDPGRYWNNQDDWRQALWVLSIMAGSWSSTSKGSNGRNVPLELLQTTINRDVAAQETNIANRLKAMEGKGRGLEKMDQLNSQRLTNLATAQNLKIDGLIKVAEARKAGLKGQQSAAGWDKAIAALKQQQVEVGATLFEDLRKEEEIKANRRFQASEAQKQRDFQRQERIAKDKADMEQAQAKAKGDAKPAIGRAQLVNPNTGIQSINRVTGEKVDGGVARDDKDAVKGMSAAATAGNKKYTTIKRMLDALDDESAADILRGGAPDVKAFYRKLAVTSARVDQPGGVLTDQDVNQGGEIVTGLAGVGWWERVKTPDDLRAMLTDSLAGVQMETQTEINNYADHEYDHTYVPRLTYPERKAQEKTPDDANQAIAGRAKISPTVKTRRPEQGETLDDESTESRAKYFLEKTAKNLPKMTPEEDSFFQEATAGLERLSIQELDHRYDAIWASDRIQGEAKERALIEVRWARAEKAAAEAAKEQQRSRDLERNMMKR